LLFVLFDFARDGASLREVMRGVLRCAVLVFLGSLIICGELERAADLFDETCELFSGLGGDSLDVSLEDEEIFGLDENIMLDKGLIVRSISDCSFIQLVLGSASS
jgi:hypothetical protein